MRDIRFFRDWLQGRNIDKSLVIEYKKELCNRYAVKSVNLMLSSINAFFVFIGWCDLKVKTLKIQRRIFADRSKKLSKAEYERLLFAAKDKKNERLYYLMQTVASTGLRVSEIKYVTCEAVRQGQAVINCKGKIRQVFLPKKLCQILKQYIKSRNIKSDSVFITRSGRPLDRCAIWKMMKDLCENAGVSKDKGCKKYFPAQKFNQ